MGTIDLALFYHNLKLQVMSLPYGSKKPHAGTDVVRDFCRPQDESDIRAMFQGERKNIAVFAGPISNNLLVLDFDDFSAYEKFLEHPGMGAIARSTMEVRTGRGAHLYFRTPFPIKGEPKNKNHVGIDIIGARQGQDMTPAYVLASNSLHPNQKSRYEICGIPRLLDVDEDELLRFPFKLNRVETESFEVENSLISRSQNCAMPYLLPGHFWKILKADPAAVSRYIKDDAVGTPGDRSKAEYCVVLHCVVNGWSWGHVLNLFQKSAAPGTKFYEREKSNPDAATRMLYCMYKDAVKWLKDHTPPLHKKIEALTAIEFSSKTKNTDNTVWQHVLNVALKTGKISNLPISVRETAESCGIDRKTAQLALNRIPLLQKTGCDRVHGTNTYSIQDVTKSPHMRALQRNVIIWGNRETSSNTFDPGHDIFRNGALGKNGRIIFSALSGGEKLSGPKIAKITGLNRVTVFRKLQRMAESGLVESFGDRYGQRFRLKPDADFDQAAKILGTAGARERQGRRHEEERESYARFRARRMVKKNEEGTAK